MRSKQRCEDDLTTLSLASLYTSVIEGYPFHPNLRELIGKFKENEGFQQTPGVMASVASSAITSEK